MMQTDFALQPEKNLASTAYVLTLLSVAGVFALVSAVLIAWPALSYLGAKMM